MSAQERHSLVARPIHRLRARRVPEYDETVTISFDGLYQDIVRRPNGLWHLIYSRGGDQ